MRTASDLVKSIGFFATANTANTGCNQQTTTQQQQQQQQQRCSSVGSTGSSTCETLSSLSGSALSPIVISSTQQAGAVAIGNKTALSAALAASAARATTTSPPDFEQSNTPAARNVGVGVGGLPHSASTATATAMAVNLADSFTLLQQQAAHHFRDILYAAHLLGQGYYQPAGPLISPHILPPVAAGPPPPPNVPLLSATGTSKKLGSDTEQQLRPQAAQTADGTDSDVLITGGDLTPFRYPAQTAPSVAHQHQHQQHHHQQQQQQQHFHQQAAAAAHAAAAAAAAAAHQGASYPRSMHAQMHYSTSYPPNYYSPYPGEAMCYSPPTYQPYFSAKVYQSAPPPPPPPGAYRRYPYYQPGPPPPPAELYEPAPQPATGSATQQAVGTGPQPPPPPTGSQLVPAGPAAHSQHLEHFPGPPGYYTSYSTGGSAAGQCYARGIQPPYMDYPPQCPCPMQQSCPKNVHSGPHIGSNNNSGGNINNYNNATAKNNNHNSSSSNSNNNNMSNKNNNSSSSSNLNTLTNNNCNNSIAIDNNNTNNMRMNHNNNSNNMSTNGSNKNNSNINNTAITISNKSNSINNNNNNNSSLSTMHVSSENVSQIASSKCKTSNLNVLSTSRGPVKNTTYQEQPPVQLSDTTLNKGINAVATTTLSTPTTIAHKFYCQQQAHSVPYDMKMVKEEPKTEELQHQQQQQHHRQEHDNNETISAKSQYEEHVVHPPTPPDSYTNMEEKLNDDATNEHVDHVIILDADKNNMKQPHNNSSNNDKNNIKLTMEAYDLTTTKTSQLAAMLPKSVDNDAQQRQYAGNNNNNNNNVLLLNTNNTIGRKARIGKTMAREMVYAAVQQPAMLQVRSSAQLTAPTQHDAATFSAPLSLTTKSLVATTSALPTTISNVNTISSTTTTTTSQVIVEDNYAKINAGHISPVKSREIPISMVLTKEEIKAEPIELKEEVLSAMLMTQQQWEEHISSDPNNEKIKLIKTEPLSESIEDEETFKNLKCMLNFDIEKQLDAQTFLFKAKERIGLLPYWQQLPLANYVERTKASMGNMEGEVLDLCKSPMYTTEEISENDTKSVNLQNYKLISSKKATSTNNGYKSLIKQAKPKSYLCLSRKAEKRARLGKLQLGRSRNARKFAANYRMLKKRRIMLTKQQKQRWRLRRKKLILLHQQRDAQVTKNNSTTDEQKLTGVNQREPQSETTTVKADIELKPPTAIPSQRKKCLASMDAVTGGYFSEPEHCSNCPTKGRKQMHKTKETVVQKRSKSETKQPTKRVCTGTENFDNEQLSKQQTSMPREEICCNFKTNNLHISLKHKKLPKATKSETKQQAKKSVKTTKTAKSCKKSTKSKNTASSSNVAINNVASNMSTNEMEYVAEQQFETNNNEYHTKLEASNETDSVDKLINILPAAETNFERIVEQQESQQQQYQQQQSQQAHSIDAQNFIQPILPPMPRIACHQHHNVGTKRSRSRSKFGVRKRAKQKHSTVSYELDDTLPPATRGDVVPKWNNGWTWDGEPFQGAVFLNSDDPLVIRTCYPAMRHREGDVIRTRDCVLLKANEDNELPYVAKVAHLWKNPEDGEMMMSLLWYYRPEHTEQGRQPNDSPDEVLASRHRDHNSVACIEDKCYVLTFSEYCRYRRRLRAVEEDIEDVYIVPKRPLGYNMRTVPDNTNPELVMFCRRAYEFRTKRLLKMPSKQDYYVVTY